MAVCSYSYSYSYPYIVVSLPLCPVLSRSSLCCLSKLSEVCQRYLRPICVHAIRVEKKTLALAHVLTQPIVHMTISLKASICDYGKLIE